jgi:hypothetical protein
MKKLFAMLVVAGMVFVSCNTKTTEEVAEEATTTEEVAPVEEATTTEEVTPVEDATATATEEVAPETPAN